MAVTTERQTVTHPSVSLFTPHVNSCDVVAISESQLHESGNHTHMSESMDSFK